MFKVIRELFEKKQSVKGLSEALAIVDKCVTPGRGVEVLDYTAGYAAGQIDMLFETGQITENERDAAIHVLENQHEKLRIAEEQMEATA